MHKQVMTAKQLASQLKEQCDYFTGVPDGALKRLWEYLDIHPAPSEHHAVAMALGARIGGARPCVLMQNSGVGYLGDVLLGLVKLYKQGVILVVGCRGEFDNEEPQHKAWGYYKTDRLLNTMGVSTIDLTERENVVLRAGDIAWRLNRPVAIMVRRGTIDEN